MPQTEWKTANTLVSYTQAVNEMEKRCADIKDGAAPELVWLVEHEPLYTAGTSAKKEDLLSPDKFPVYESGRGGEYTYHGPGQRVAYVMLNLANRMDKPDIKRFVHDLQEWIILTLADFGIKGERREGRIGIWVNTKEGKEAKIAALGVRVRHWVSFHGISINLKPDLEHFSGIVPCGITNYGVTSFEEQGVHISMEELDARLKVRFEEVFGKG
jgi:lipoyl(octanoyl) transferase